jgi:hypothetical protein
MAGEIFEGGTNVYSFLLRVASSGIFRNFKMRKG